MTYGNLKLRLVKAFPGVDLTLIEGWIGDVYADILDDLSWTRQKLTGILQTAAPYSTGSVTVTAGDTAITGSGTTWTSDMTGRAFRVTGRTEYYEFTYASATTGTLDRAYEGSTAAGAGYSIFQFVYPMPADCALLESDAFPSLARLSGPQIDATSTGTPTNWASYMDDASTPPRMQVELYPAPDAAVGIPFTYVADSALPANSASFQAWVNPTALIEGVTSKIKAHAGDYAGAAYHKLSFREAVDNMKGVEARGMANAEIRLPSYFTAHRRGRW